MNKKIIVLSLMLLNLQIVCSQKLAIQLKIPCFEISYSDDRVKQLKQHNIKSSHYGFDSGPLKLTYNEERDLGVVSLDEKVLQRLNITQQQFSNIKEEVKDKSSIASLEFNKDFPLKSPLYIIAKGSNEFIFYKIEWFNQVRFSEVDKAIRNFDTESVVDIAKQSILIGVAIGTISTLLLMCVFKKIYYS